MARYFSEQTLLDMRDKDMNYVYDLVDLEQYLAGVPTADVAPKSEVAREIIDEFMSAMRVKHKENRPKYGGALALLLPDIEQIAAELKKKYTEGKQ